MSTEIPNSEEDSYKSNIMEDVHYSSKDAKGNEYTCKASQGRDRL